MLLNFWIESLKPWWYSTHPRPQCRVLTALLSTGGATKGRTVDDAVAGVVEGVGTLSQSVEVTVFTGLVGEHAERQRHRVELAHAHTTSVA